MKTTLVIILTLFCNLLFSQLKPDLKQVHVKVENIDLNLDKFSRQHSLGSTFQFTGLLFATTGLIMNYNHTPQLGKVPPGHLLVALGLISVSTGIFINLNSYKFLRQSVIQ